MNSAFRLSHTLTRHLVRGVLVAFLLSQAAWADHLHLDTEHNTGCSVCAFVDNSPAVTAAEAVQLLSFKHLGYQLPRHTESPLSPPSFNHHSRAPPLK